MSKGLISIEYSPNKMNTNLTVIILNIIIKNKIDKKNTLQELKCLTKGGIIMNMNKKIMKTKKIMKMKMMYMKSLFNIIITEKILILIKENIIQKGLL